LAPNFGADLVAPIEQAFSISSLSVGPSYLIEFHVARHTFATVLKEKGDLYFVYMLAKGKNWLIVNPQPIFDHENDVALAQVDLEWGFMIVPKSGISGYLRPGFGIGEHRPFNYNFEVAIKFVWR
jgi:hypothetical protein